jgi:hypothetical protein
MVFQDQFMNYPDVFFHSGGQGLPWAMLVCKWQFIPEAGKRLVNLCFPQSSITTVSLATFRNKKQNFTATRCSNFSAIQKSTNKREALKKNIYYVASRLHLTMPVSRLMQKGPRKRHLAAKACTTTDQNTREWFWFVGSPLV